MTRAAWGGLSVLLSLGLAMHFGLATRAASAADRPATIEVPRPSEPNTLSGAEREAGWALLFDGHSTDAWRAAESDAFPRDGWTLDGDALALREAGLFEFRAGGDLFTRERFGDFILDFEFRMAPGANSGVKYRAETQRQWGYVHALGCEFQILDDAHHPDATRGRPGTRRLAALYDVIAANEAPFHGVQAWNHGRIHLEKGRLSHYLNGVRVIDVEQGSPEWRRAVEGSKFADVADHCRVPTGHIVLQDHGDAVWFRNLRIRRLDSRPGLAVDAAARRQPFPVGIRSP